MNHGLPLMATMRISVLPEGMVRSLWLSILAEERMAHLGVDVSAAEQYNGETVKTKLMAAALWLRTS